MIPVLVGKFQPRTHLSLFAFSPCSVQRLNVQRIATEEAYCNIIGFSSEAQFFKRALENVRELACVNVLLCRARGCSYRRS